MLNSEGSSPRSPTSVEEGFVGTSFYPQVLTEDFQRAAYPPRRRAGGSRTIEACILSCSNSF